MSATGLNRLFLAISTSILVLAARETGAQPLGTFSWQMAPYCNVLTLVVTHTSGVFTLDGFDAQCGDARRAPVTGLATFNPNGGALAGACASDARFKRDVVPYAGVLARVGMLRPVQFSWRTEAFPERAFGGARETGLIAQDVEQAFPDLVSTDASGYKAVDYSKLPLIALQAIRELKVQNDALQAENAALARRLAAIEATLKKR